MGIVDRFKAHYYITKISMIGTSIVDANTAILDVIEKYERSGVGRLMTLQDSIWLKDGKDIPKDDVDRILQHRGVYDHQAREVLKVQKKLICLREKVELLSAQRENFSAKLWSLQSVRS